MGIENLLKEKNINIPNLLEEVGELVDTERSCSVEAGSHRSAFGPHGKYLSTDYPTHNINPIFEENENDASIQNSIFHPCLTQQNDNDDSVNLSISKHGIIILIIII